MQSARHYASAGVLSIETECPSFDQHDYLLRANIKGGSFGWVTPSLTYWQRVGEQTSLAAHVSYMRADGVYPFTLRNGYVKTKEKRYNSDVESCQGEMNLYHHFLDGNASMRVLTEPRFFDVIVTENTFGDILTDETSCITGSMGLQPSASLGEHTPLFEPVHGSWPQAAGKNLANPLAQILSAAMLLEEFGLKEEGALIRKAVDESLAANVRTPEIQVDGGAHYGTKEVGEWIVNYIKNA